MSLRFVWAVTASGYSLEPGTLILNLILTVAIYSLPIIIYRYAIRKEPVSPKTGKAITIVYGIFAFIFMLLIASATGGSASGGAIFLWSYVNYKILTKGWVQYRDTETAAQERAESGWRKFEIKEEESLPKQAETDLKSQEVPEVTAQRKDKKKRPKYCDLCGNKLSADDEFCDSCGARVTDMYKE
ncbi:MAG TPA: zinc ribbon domain-containing protein [Oscillospiraceae bacterium]|nr:zinc ribbon domain-containing protein [Oscillospiraceae bacterium]HPF56687.1 zinc ribbon domain-containing protein [Clostridiales bacterium]HPK35162.1 zinc ribbon domain-containing protein [Oscillospiraceae bacterium]HPR74965.1 zinc ribbon domain-containing protein [Oscillospiraceae bacterium]